MLEKYSFSCNGGVEYSVDDMLRLGTYNALIGETAYYSSKNTGQLLQLSNDHQLSTSCNCLVSSASKLWSRTELSMSEASGLLAATNASDTCCCQKHQIFVHQRITQQMQALMAA